MINKYLSIYDPYLIDFVDKRFSSVIRTTNRFNKLKGQLQEIHTPLWNSRTTEDITSSEIQKRKSRKLGDARGTQLKKKMNTVKSNMTQLDGAHTHTPCPATSSAGTNFYSNDSKLGTQTSHTQSLNAPRKT